MMYSIFSNVGSAVGSVFGFGGTNNTNDDNNDNHNQTDQDAALCDDDCSASSSSQDSPDARRRRLQQQEQEQQIQRLIMPQPPQIYYFAKHLANETEDRRYLASKYHQGINLATKQASNNNGNNNKHKKHAKNSNNNNSGNNFSSGSSSSADNIGPMMDGPTRPPNDASFPLCKICSVQPATYFASDLSAVFVDNNNNNKNNNNHSNVSDSSSPQVQICLGCFIVAFRALVLPELVNRDPEQRRAIEQMIETIQETQLVDSVDTPRADEHSSSAASADSSNFYARSRSTSLSRGGAGATANANQERTLLCVNCRFPCKESAGRDCPECSVPSPWHVKCVECNLKCSAATTPPICSKTRRAHVLWCCEHCTMMNTQDVPECSQCEKLRSWKCPRCKVSQNSKRSAQGERHCSRCGYGFAEMTTTTIRRFGLEEESVRRADKAHHERERAAYKIDRKMESLFANVQEMLNIQQEHENNKNNNKTQPAGRSSSSSSKNKSSGKKNAKNNKSAPSLWAKLKRTSQEGDGNCAFRSMSFNLFGTPNGHMLIRKAVCLGLMQRKDELSPWFENQTAFMNYVGLMEQSGTWADEMALRMTAVIFGVNIHIISSDDHHWYTRFAPFAASFAWDEEEEARLKKLTEKQLEAEEKKKRNRENERPHIFLAYSAPVHYDSLSIMLYHTTNQLQQQNSNGSSNNDDDEGVSSTSRIQPVSISQLVKDLAQNFVNEEDEWDDVNEQ